MHEVPKTTKSNCRKKVPKLVDTHELLIERSFETNRNLHFSFLRLLFLAFRHFGFLSPVISFSCRSSKSIHNKCWSERPLPRRNELLPQKRTLLVFFSVFAHPRKDPRRTKFSVKTTKKFRAFFLSLSLLRSIHPHLQIHFFRPSRT